MKRTLTILTSFLSLSAITALAADDEDNRFHPGEFDVSPFATYVDKTGDKWGAGASLTYYLTDRIGLGACTYWTDFGGTFIDNLAGEAYFRLPLFDIVSPYAVGGIGYQFDSTEWFETLGLGVDFRPFKNLSAFGDIQYRFANETKDGVFIRLGVRFSF
jgi:hypothetical protein